jgi:FtsP/CotA-like multicopper oxidase with cupredoxin domain
MMPGYEGMAVMKVRRLTFFVVAALGAFLWMFRLPAAAAGTGGMRPPVADVCAEPGPVGAWREPPTLDASQLPHDAAGRPELILIVRQSPTRFCYRYTWKGVWSGVAPTLRVHPGEQLAIRIVNAIGKPRHGAVSPLLPSACRPMPMPMPPVIHRVGYLNHTIDDRYLPMPASDTNVHLHGFEGPAAEENIFLSTLSTRQGACEYVITIPRSQPLGTYVYHPHAHGTSEAQVGGNLSGVWIVESDRPAIPRADDHVVILRYAAPVRVDNAFAPDEDPLEAAGAAHEAGLRPAAPVTYDPFHPPPWPVSFPMPGAALQLDADGCNGLFAEPLLTVNGIDAPAVLPIPADRTQLLRIVNATSDSPKLLGLQDASGRAQPLRVVGVDGVPVSGNEANPLAGYLPMRDVMVPPMGRVDILVSAENGANLTLSSRHFCEGVDGFFQMQHDVLHIHAAESSAGSDDSILSRAVAIDHTPAARLVAYAREHPSRIHRRAITFTEYLFPPSGKVPAHFGFYVTDTTNPPFREHPFWPLYAAGTDVPNNPDVVVRAGTIEEWYLINATMEAHAFHIHQMTFVDENSREGLPLTRDTVFVPVGSLMPNPRDPAYPLVRPAITRILLDFRHVPRGTFVFHCHMLFHEDHGMMATIRVE